MFVTASTGIAACNIGGVTVHSFAGLGIHDQTINQTLKRIRQNEAAVGHWQSCEVLIIDEISMLDGQLFDQLEYVARVLRKCDYPFGGIQVVLCGRSEKRSELAIMVVGDFFQLPPVGLGKNGVCYCFESRWWNAVIDVRIVVNILLPVMIRNR